MTRKLFATSALVVLIASAFLTLPLPKTAIAAGPNLILNPSLETANAAGTMPQNWLNNKWGTNTATFTYPVAGQDGAKGAKVTMTAFTNGDAKWYFQDVAVTPGQLYSYSNYYKATVPTEVVVRYTSTTGTHTYSTIANPAISAAWQAVNATFTPPAGTSSVTVFHVIHAVGTLEVDNFSISTGTTPPPPPPVSGNLILNPSLETANGAGTQPANWLSNKWGTATTTFTYPVAGQEGTKAAKITTTAYTSGDAKWYFADVLVTAGQQYTFSDYYKATVPTQLVVRYTSTTGVLSYDTVATLPVAAAWQASNATFTPPVGTASVTMFHIIYAVGTLEVDNFSLTTGTTPPPVTNHVPNSSVEQSAGTPAIPTDWHGENWGTNTPTYEYVNEGYDGTKSVKVTVTNYVDGDAKWAYTPQVLTRGGDYAFSAWYKTNTIPHVVAQYIKDDGSEEFFGMSDPQPNGSGWQQYNGVFSVPSDVQAVSVFFFISNNGWVQTDKYSVTPYTYPTFNRGLVTLTFDDGFEQNITTALPVLNLYGLKATHCNATQYVEGIPAQVTNLQTYVAHGQEICSHTVSHPSLLQATTAQLTYELTHSQTFLKSITGQSVSNFSSPFGEYNAAINTEIAKYYSSHRTTDEGYNSKDNFDAYRLKVQNMQQDTTLAEFQSWVNKAKQDKTWLILVYHVVNTSPSLEQFDTKKVDFDAQMAWLSTAGVTVQRWDQSLAEVKAQLP